MSVYVFHSTSNRNRTTSTNYESELPLAETASIYKSVDYRSETAPLFTFSNYNLLNTITLNFTILNNYGSSYSLLTTTPNLIPNRNNFFVGANLTLPIVPPSTYPYKYMITKSNLTGDVLQVQLNDYTSSNLFGNVTISYINPNSLKTIWIPSGFYTRVENLVGLYVKHHSTNTYSKIINYDEETRVCILDNDLSQLSSNLSLYTNLPQTYNSLSSTIISTGTSNAIVDIKQYINTNSDSLYFIRLINKNRLTYANGIYDYGLTYKILSVNGTQIEIDISTSNYISIIAQSYDNVELLESEQYKLKYVACLRKLNESNVFNTITLDFLELFKDYINSKVIFVRLQSNEAINDIHTYSSISKNNNIIGTFICTPDKNKINYVDDSKLYPKVLYRAHNTIRVRLNRRIVFTVTIRDVYNNILETVHVDIQEPYMPVDILTCNILFSIV